MVLVNWSPIRSKMISIIIACMNFNAFEWKLGCKMIQYWIKIYLKMCIIIILKFRKFDELEFLLMAWWWFATDSLSGASSGPGWNLSFLVCLWKNWSNNESGIFLGVAKLFFFISPCLWGAFFGSTLRPVNGSMSSHCWGLKNQ